MLSPNIGATSPRPAAANWLFAGHPSANPQRLAARFLGAISTLEIDDTESDFSAELAGIDAVALIINAKTGVSKGMIDFWSYIAERQFPRLLIVCGLEMSETDFDDIVMIANRVLEPVLTPFLVLHDELGEPSGLIELETLTVRDYSGSEVIQYPADEELISLITEFKEELETQKEEFGDVGFSQGLLVPALPIGEQRSFGVNEIQGFLNSINSEGK